MEVKECIVRMRHHRTVRRAERTHQTQRVEVRVSTLALSRPSWRVLLFCVTRKPEPSTLVLGALPERWLRRLSDDDKNNSEVRQCDEYFVMGHKRTRRGRWCAFGLRRCLRSNWSLASRALRSLENHRFIVTIVFLDNLLLGRRLRCLCCPLLRSFNIGLGLIDLYHLIVCSVNV